MIEKVILLATVLTLVKSTPVLLGTPHLAYNSLYHPHYYSHPYAVRSPVVVPHITASQYHAQDELGQTSYGYAHPGQSKAEFRDAFGNVVGSYSYIDANNKEVVVNYVSDANGFRVVSNNLPVAAMANEQEQVQETPEVIEAKRQHFAAIAEAKARVVEAKTRGKRSIPTVLPFHPFATNTLPLTYSYPLTIPSITATKYHSQDELGQASYGYAYAGHSHAATRDVHGNVIGSYAYINPEGKEVRVRYTAGHGGFQVISNALPEGNNHDGFPAIVEDTAEVIAARNAHLKAFKEAKDRIRHKE
ncbi:uncharacterized protein LOC136043943 [Artemia franciscana]|uniref:Cuticle protein n=1 Tax=Artemia franciscana TaxID=6661 RepID=A0AA88L7R3_ARTSF|nr:hypothetical protein QYM36_010604 [Artemia franciscana]